MVRKALYKLYDHSLVPLRQSRDKETGWFIFNWRLQPDQLEDFILNQKRRVLEKLETRLEYEKSHEFYTCQTPGCKRFPFEESFELKFWINFEGKTYYFCSASCKKFKHHPKKFVK